MTDYPHYTYYSSLSEALIDFGNLARNHGLMVGTQETLDTLSAAGKGLINDRMTMRFALKAIYCCEREDREIFDKIFDGFWGDQRLKVQRKVLQKNQSNLRKKAQASLVMMGKGRQEEGREEAKRISGANTVERLRKTDFSRIGEMDSAWLEELAMKLWREMSLRLKRKMKRSGRKDRVDIRQTIRAGIGQGGDLIRLHHKSRKKRKERLIMLLDVSGSMDRYSFFLLRFICALGVHFEKIEAFIFSTTLIRITDHLRTKNLQVILPTLSAHTQNWSSGTRIGECLQSFNETYAKTVLQRSSTVIILSDGLDTGDPEDLAREVKRIKLRTRRLVWLNPLKGMPGYQPIQKGMRAALPEVDVFRSAHNLNSLLELENLLADV